LPKPAFSHRSSTSRIDRPLTNAPITNALSGSGAAQPRIELVLNRPLDDQPGAQSGELGQRLARALTHTNREHVLNPSLNLRGTACDYGFKEQPHIDAGAYRTRRDEKSSTSP
jgi:hypothetical protein